MNQATPFQQAPAFYRLKVGDLKVTALCDGHLQLPRAVFPALTEQDEVELARAAFMKPGAIPSAVNCFAVETADKLMLIDAGVGPSRGPATGQLPVAMAAAGLDPSRIATVLMTHLHGDHAGGLLDAAGQRLFPEAEIFVAEPEFRFWSDPGLVSRMPDMLKPTAMLAAKVLEIYRDHIRPFAPGGEMAPAIQSVPLYGHTPGHTGYMLGDGEDALFIWADIVHVAAYQFVHPEWGLLFDIDPAEASAARARTFERVAAERLKVAGMHLAFPGHGHVEKGAGGYRYVPMPWMPLA